MSRTAGTVLKALLGTVLVAGLVLVAANVVFGVALPGAGEDRPDTDSAGPSSASNGTGGASPDDGTNGDGSNGGQSGSNSQSREVTYSVSHADVVQRNYTTVLRESFEFWEAEGRNPERLDFVYTTDADDSDIHVAFTGIIEECQGDRSGGTFSFCSVETDTDQSRVRVSGVYEPAGMEALLRNVAGQYAGHDSPSEFEGVPDLSTARLQFLDPWPTEETVTVNLSVESGSDRDWGALVGEGLDYWQANQDRYATYTQDLVFDPDAPDAEVTVSIVEDITQCGVHDDPDVEPLGCADRYNRSLLADETVRVRVESGWDDATTLQTLKHEFGHVYGLTHGEGPVGIMNATYSDARTVPEPNVSERANPFGSDGIDVAVDYGSFSAVESDVRQQVRHAVEYYDRGGGGTVDPAVEIRLHDDPETADIVVRKGQITRCSDGDTGSCGQLSRSNTDSDPAWEYYTRQEISLRGIDTATVGWHVGYWMGFSVATADSQSELPPPFGESDYEHVRNWWK